MKSVRNLKAYGQIGHTYKSTPAIMMKGLRFKKLRFAGNTLISVKCEIDRRVIEFRESKEERIFTAVIQNDVSMVAADWAVYRWASERSGDSDLLKSWSHRFD